MRGVIRLTNLFILFIACCSFAEPFILIKIPTRGRPDQLFETLDAYEKNLSREVAYRFLITCDNDDSTMNNKAVIEKLSSYPDLRYEFTDNRNCIEAYNSGLGDDKFDIVIVASDDRKPIAKQFDKIIVEQFLSCFQSFDGVLVYRTGNRKSDYDAVFVIGREYLERFGYLFNPLYSATYAIQELISIAKMLRRYELSTENLFYHSHRDKKIKSAAMEGYDQEIFIERRKHMFDLTDDFLRSVVDKEWSILICTMYERQESFQRIYNKLQDQIRRLGLEDRIEILYYLDNRGEHSIGAKRNWLLTHSNGYYINFIDDDDDVSDEYIKVIHDALIQNPDSVSLRGLIAFSKQDVRLFIHSIKYDSWFEKNHVYYRPPNHLNTIKRHIGVQFSFPDISNGEDRDWSMQIALAGLVKTEVDIQTPYYYYLPSYCHGRFDFSVFHK